MFYILLHPPGISTQLDLMSGLNSFELNPFAICRKLHRHILPSAQLLQQYVRFQAGAMIIRPLEPQEHLSISQVERIACQLHAPRLRQVLNNLHAPACKPSYQNVSYQVSFALLECVHN
jgi:hypothetical protein